MRPLAATVATGVALAGALAWLATTFIAEAPMLALPPEVSADFASANALHDADLPARERGRAYYAQLCVSCHGVRGDGHGEWAYRMKPRPANLASVSVRRRSDAELNGIISEGLPGTPMIGWQRHLSQAQRSDLIAYVRQLGADDATERSH